MRKSTVYFIIRIGLFLSATVFNAASEPILSDAAFAPDWNMIGLATSDSFRIYDPSTKQQFYTFPLEKGAQFIKWSPDHSLVLLTSGENEQGAFYLVLDWQKRKILCSFQDKVRWYYNHWSGGSYPGEIYYNLDERTFPIATKIGHPNSIAVSPNNREIAYISSEGNIRIREIETGEIKKEFSIPDYHLSSLGYTPDGSRLWVGEVYASMEAQSKPSYLLYFDHADGKIVDIKNLGYDRLVYLVRDDQKYALALGTAYGSSDAFDPTIPNFIIDLQKDVNTSELRFNYSITVDYLPRFRSIFSGIENIFSNSQTDHSLLYPFSVYDYQQITEIQFLEARGEVRFLSSHPISSDGHTVILINERQMFLMDYFAQSIETVFIEPVQVEDFSQHETIPLHKEKQLEE